MASYKVEICGVNTAKLPILKDEEKDVLFARIKQGDTAARETYIKGNLRLVLSVIKRFSGNHENVRRWRLEQSLALTRERRKDLYRRYIKKKEKK